MCCGGSCADHHVISYVSYLHGIRDDMPTCDFLLRIKQSLEGLGDEALPDILNSSTLPDLTIHK